MGSGHASLGGHSDAEPDPEPSQESDRTGVLRVALGARERVDTAIYRANMRDPRALDGLPGSDTSSAGNVTVRRPARD